jgi:D-arabinose 1-dehydrogenase-like Zn-dependent alcohol dehydrogenase
VCHSDAITVEGHMPIEYPRIPGHEVASVVDAIGEGVEGYAPGDRVGVGWFGGCCFRCEPSRRGNFIACENGKVSGISYDGGYAEAMVAPWEALARIPDDLSDAEAAPLLCAGITTFNGLRSSVARPGALPDGAHDGLRPARA